MTRRRLIFLISGSLLIASASMLLKHLMATPSPTHAIVIGSGLAGLSAASQLIAHNIPVHLLERTPRPGGNSIKASSGINGAPTKYQSFPDTAFYSDTVKSAGPVLLDANKERRESLISTLTNDSTEAVRWLVEEKGVDLSVVAQLGGHTFPRTHRGAGGTPPGYSIISTLLASLNASPLFHLHTSCTVTKILHSSSAKAVVGVEYINPDSDVPQSFSGPVVVASGGFAGDAHGLLATYRPDLAGFPSTNTPRPGSQGLLTAVGAQLLDMELVQVHPTSFIDPKDSLNPVKFLAGELLRGEGGLLLDGEGRRFVDEMQTRKVVTAAVMTLEVMERDPRMWNVSLVLDEGAYDAVKSHVDFYLAKGLMKKTTAKDLGPHAVDSIQSFADAAAGNGPDKFGRTSFGRWKLQEVKPESVVYIGCVTPAVHFTMGGVAINKHSQVLGADGEPIGSVWAAGEVTGGIHGENRLGGSSLLECVVFGRRAGEGVVKFLSDGGIHVQ